MNTKKVFHWPNDARVAVVFHMAWEAWPDNLGTGDSYQKTARQRVPGRVYQLDTFEINQHAFAETGGLQRLIGLYERWDVPVTCVISGATIEAYPSLVRELDQRNYDLGIQNWDHEYLVMYDEEEERASIERSYKAFESVLGRAPTGFVAPAARYTDHTYDILADLGIGWVLAGRNAETPYVVKRPGKAHPLVFQQQRITDFESFGASATSPQTVIVKVKDEFDTLYEEGETGVGKMMSYATHPFLATGYRTKPLEGLIEYVKSKPDVWITTREKITEWVLSEFPNLTLDALYGEVAVASDRRYSLNLAL